MSKNIEENYKKVYQCMNAALKYYKKWSGKKIDWDLQEGNYPLAVAEGVKLRNESTIPEFTADLMYAVQKQLAREEKKND